MNFPVRSLITTTLLAFVLHGVAAGQNGFGQLRVPPVPDNLRVPEGNVPFLKGSAVGTQNYMCLPGANGPAWTFLAPQATLFATIPWLREELRVQVTTHFLSANPAEDGVPRPTWQSSFDTSAVWGRAIANSTDPKFVAAGAIPWLLVQVAGSQAGPTNGSALLGTTFIHRVNTSGGIAPTSGCDDSSIGKLALVPYTTDYFFYKAAGRN
ncbi:MAG TPA: DUF3455 domain-containing protein [Bryobacteraceae bacterium]|nr:DUF3455 domain-containing protein [Bryobacteraceae bacterium]